MKRVWQIDLRFLFETTVLLFFTIGYLFSTAIARAIWRGRGVWWHPIIVAALFLTHFEILNVGAGGAFEPPERLRLRVAGTLIAFVCALAGDRFLRKWIRPEIAGLGLQRPGIVSKKCQYIIQLCWSRPAATFVTACGTNRPRRDCRAPRLRRPAASTRRELQATDHWSAEAPRASAWSQRSQAPESAQTHRNR